VDETVHEGEGASVQAPIQTKTYREATAEATALGESTPGENGAPVKCWRWVCPKCVEGRLHIAGYNRDRHGLYTVCDRCESTFVR
jgi:hypothetical protein